MAKLQRKVDPIQMNQAKERTIARVIDKIESEPKAISWNRILRPVFLPITAIIVVFAILFFPDGIGPLDEPGVLSAYESEKLAELSYLSSSFIGANLTVNNELFQFLADGDDTEFEQDQRVNFYFDTLRLYLEDIDFTNVVTTEELTNDEFDYLITFELQGNTYEFYVSIVGETITGELSIGTVTFEVTGKLEETETETTFELEAINGNDYVHIEYKTESEDEIESKYQVQSRINGVETEQEIKVSLESDEAKVEIKDGDNEYTLKRETEDDGVFYKLEYKINGIEGEARIHETTDTDGNAVYQYSVKEGDTEKEVERGRPDYDYDDDDFPGNGNPGSNKDDSDDEDEDEEDEEDEEDDTSESTNGHNNQSNTLITEKDQQSA